MDHIEILLVEDNPDDIDLAREALAEIDAPTHLTVAEDGAQAMAILRKEGEHAEGQTPHFILLDLKLPRKSGLQVLEETKADQDLRRIPVVVLTTSDAEGDILDAYELHANAYVVKPIDLDDFITVVKEIINFWGATVSLPTSR